MTALAVVGKTSNKLQAKRSSNSVKGKSSAGNSTVPSLLGQDSSDDMPLGAGAEASDLPKVPEVPGFSGNNN